MMKNKILINTSSFDRTHSELNTLEFENGFKIEFNPYGRRLKKEELLSLVCSSTVAVISGLEVIDREILNKTEKNLKVISRCGIGVDNLSSLKDSDLLIYTTPDAPTQAVAELTISLMLSTLRKINEQHNSIVRGKWVRQMGSLLSGKHVGLIGFGRIGQRVAKILSGFCARVSYYDLHSSENPHASHERSLEKLAKESDIISLHVSVSDATKNIINAKLLNCMKKEVILVNTARGELINESDLSSFLIDNKEAAAALDVFQKEPYNGELVSLPNVLLTPHVGSYAKEARMAMEKQALRNLIDGLKIRGLINDN